MFHYSRISCSPPGYADYFAVNPGLPSSYWTQGVMACTPPYPSDGTRNDTWPEQFFNCAEISISKGQSGPTISPKPTPVPTTARPTISPPPNPPITVLPSQSPTSSASTYGATDCKTSYDALLDMDPITKVISSNPPLYSIVAEGGAAGGGGFTVSEGQAYGVLTAAIVLASFDTTDPKRLDVMDKFYGMFNGWKRMCQNSSPPACQNPMYCDG